MATLIDRALLDAVTAEAKAGPRGRKNRNFHSADAFPVHRLLNAIEPGSYVQPHRHLEPAKDETLVVLRGRLGLVLFDDAGEVVRRAVLGPDEETLGVDIPHGTWHSMVALVSGTVFFEAKAGPYLPLTAEEKAAWAPAEGEPLAARYAALLATMFA